MNRKSKATEEVLTDPEQDSSASAVRSNPLRYWKSRQRSEFRRRVTKVVKIDIPLDGAGVMRVQALGIRLVRRRGKFMEELVTDRQRIADLARVCRECGDVEIAETLEVATEVRMVIKGDRLDHFEIPSYALPESERNRALNKIVTAQKQKLN